MEANRRPPFAAVAPRRAARRALRRVSGAAAGLALLAWAGAASANDGVAAYGIGGIEMASTDAVEMAQEDLFISRDEVRVRYEFRNVSGEDYSTLVAFPLPPFFLDEQIQMAIGPAGDLASFVGFRVVADGREVAPEAALRAVRLGQDVTAVLAGHGLPVLPDLPAYERIAALDPAARQALADLRLIVPSGDQWAPAWDVQTVYYWPQDFPAGATVTVEHRYRPVAGGSYLTGADEIAVMQVGAEPFLARFCVDDATAGAIAALAGEAPRPWAEVDYILTTASTWRGPIGTFHLTIDKGRPDTVVSLCLDGLAPTGPTTLETTRAGWTPDQDLRILFVDPP